MSKRKPWFEARIGYAIDTPQDGGFYCNEYKDDIPHEQRVRVVDARELTPEKAVERVLNQLHGLAGWDETHIKEIASKVDMSARVVNGKVRVRKVKT